MSPVPSGYIRYPQDVSLLNKTREKLEERFSGFTKPMGCSSTERLPDRKETVPQFRKIKETLGKANPQGSEEADFLCQTKHWISGRIYVGRIITKTKGYSDDTYHLQTL